MRMVITLTVTAALAATLAASAQLTNATAAIKHHQAAFTLLATYFGCINLVVKGERPFNRVEVLAGAQLVETIGRLPWIGFAPGSDTGKTKAKPDIWLEEERFNGLREDMQAKVAVLRVSVQDGDLIKLQGAFKHARDSCQVCHKGTVNLLRRDREQATDAASANITWP